MHPSVESSISKTMYILGQIGAVICHDRGPSLQTDILTTLASRPADGFALAVARMDMLCPPTRGHRRTMLRWKLKEIERLRAMLPPRLPADACAKTQMPFWAGYCQYWEDVLKVHVEQDVEAVTHDVDETHRRIDA